LESRIISVAIAVAIGLVLGILISVGRWMLTRNRY